MLDQDPAIPHISVWLKGIQNDRFRNYFINRFADVMNTNYQYERISAIEQNMYNLTRDEMYNEFMRWGDPGNIPGQMMAFTGNHLTLQQQFMLRTEQVRNHIQSNFNLPNLVNLTLDVIPANAGKIQISTITPDNYPWDGVYFNGIPLGITAEAAPGFYFSHWKNNGLIADTLNAHFLDTLNVETTRFTAVFEEEHVGASQLTADAEDFYLFPNPAENVIYISNKSRLNAEYQIIDQKGQIMLQGRINSAQNESAVNISTLKPSFYVVRIKGNSMVPVNLRFIKTGYQR
jgi:hypothetical protein